MAICGALVWRLLAVAGAPGGPGYPAALGLAVQVGDPGVYQLALDGRVHCGLLGTASLGLVRACV
jgi:hypothetical protein